MTSLPPEGRSVDAAAALRAHLAELERELRERDNTLAASLGRQSTELADLQDLVGSLVAQVTSLQGDSRYTPAPNWLTLATDDAEYRKQFTALSEWVDGFLRPNYGCQEIHDCWAHHTRAIWELGNIWAEWCRVYNRDRAELLGALAWHDRWLPGALRRLEPVMIGCVTACTQQRRRGAA
jgi:hypothetical protein